MAWPTGFSWTKTHYEEAQNPDGTKEQMRVQGGPFFFSPKVLGSRLYVYCGFRPTATWSTGYGNEGWFVPVARIFKKFGCGNFGIAVRWKRGG